MKRRTLMTLPARGAKKRRSPARWVLRPLGAAVVLLLAYAAVFAVAAWRREYPLAAAAAPATSPRGAWHVHSTLSHDGRGTPEEIARAAAGAGLHFVVLADHNPQELLPPRYESGVLLIFAQELSTPHGHVVAAGTSRALTEEERRADVFAAIDALGGEAFLPHPAQQKNPWRDWERAPRARGLELYSADSMFRDALRRPLSTLVPAAASWVTNPVHGLLTVVAEQPEATGRLLQLAGEQPYVALCAHDAHGLPSYASEFATLSMYLPPLSGGPALPADPEEAARHVLSALGRGEGWCAFHGIAAGDGFAVQGASGEGGRIAHPGDLLTLALPAAAPKDTQVRIFGPGKLQPDGRVQVEAPGALQVEVWARVPGIFFEEGWRPWLVPSPIRVLARPDPVPAPPADGGAPETGVSEATGP